MTLPTGTITMAQVAGELGLSTSGINLNNSAVRALAGRTSGSISMSHLRGKAATAVVPITYGYLSHGIKNVYKYMGVGSGYGAFTGNTSVFGKTISAVYLNTQHNFSYIIFTTTPPSFSYVKINGVTFTYASRNTNLSTGNTVGWGSTPSGAFLLSGSGIVEFFQ